MVSPVTTVLVGVAGQTSYKWTNSPAALSTGGASVKVNGATATWTASGDMVTITAPAITDGARIELISTAATLGLLQTAVPIRKTYS